MEQVTMGASCLGNVSSQIRVNKIFRINHFTSIFLGEDKAEVLGLIGVLE